MNFAAMVPRRSLRGLLTMGKCFPTELRVYGLWKYFAIILKVGLEVAVIGIVS